MSGSLFLLLPLLILLGSYERASGAAAAKKLIIAYAAMNARVCPLWAPRERGFFARERY